MSTEIDELTNALSTCNIETASETASSVSETASSIPEITVEINRDLEYTITENEKAKYTNPKAHFKSAEEERDWARTQPTKCRKCDKLFPLTYFNVNTSGADPFDQDGYRLRRRECRNCTKMAARGKGEAEKIAKQLGIPFKAPAGTKCELCNTTDKIVFDHDHTTKKFRGRLCNTCNRSMGCLGDNVEGLLKVLNYLNKSEKKKIVTDPDTNELRITEE
jgi:hypothetical protein